MFIIKRLQLKSNNSMYNKLYTELDGIMINLNTEIICAKENCTKFAYKSKKGESPYCAAHGGNVVDINSKKAEARAYYKTKWNAKIDEKTKLPNTKSLAEELGILRVLMEERLNQCADAYELNMEAHSIQQLALNIERIVTSIHGMDLRVAITEENIKAIIDVIAIVLSDNIKDKELLESINTGITNGIKKLEHNI